MFLQDVHLLLEIVLFVSPHLFQLLVTYNSRISEDIFASIGDSFDSNLEAYSFQESLSGHFVEPVEFEHERQEIYLG